jgi:hypothetical protein
MQKFEILDLKISLKMRCINNGNSIPCTISSQLWKQIGHRRLLRRRKRTRRRVSFLRWRWKLKSNHQKCYFSPKFYSRDLKTKFFFSSPTILFVTTKGKNPLCRIGMHSNPFLDCFLITPIFVCHIVPFIENGVSVLYISIASVYPTDFFFLFYFILFYFI